MTDKQLEHLKRASRRYGIHTDLTDEEKAIHKKTWCIDMINSVIAYDGCKMEYILNNKYMQDYINELGVETVKELAQAQIDDVLYVKHNVYTDSEGCSYNSIVWRET